MFASNQIDSDNFIHSGIITQGMHSSRMVQEIPIGGSIVWPCPLSYNAEWTHRPISGNRQLDRKVSYSSLKNINHELHNTIKFSNLYLRLVTRKHGGFYKCSNGRHDQYIYYLQVLGKKHSL